MSDDVFAHIDIPGVGLKRVLVTSSGDDVLDYGHLNDAHVTLNNGKRALITLNINGILSQDIANWDEAYGWGNHAEVGYLTSEDDPAFLEWDKSTGISITMSQISDLAESDPVFSLWDKSSGISITESQISDLQSYLLSETDPIFSAAPASSITAQNIADWVTAHGWGDHSLAGYLTEEVEPDFNAWNKSDGISIAQSQISNLSIAEGRIPFADSIGKLIDDSKLFWDKNNDCLALGHSNPERTFHIQDNNATIRIDRDTNSPAVQLHRFPLGDWEIPWKGFMFRVNASGPDEGTFAIIDYHQSVTGGGDVRFEVDSIGDIVIPGVLDVGEYFTAEKIYLQDSGTDYLGWTPGDNVFEFSGGLMIGGTLFCNDLNGDSITIATADITDLLETPIIRNTDGDTVTIQDNLNVTGNITGGNAGNWNAAYGWGDHAQVGYLTGENDPVFVASPSYGIAAQNIINWNIAYGWGDHSSLAPKASPTFTGDISFPGIGIWKSTGIGIGTIDPKEELHIKSNHPTIAFEELDGSSNEKVWEFGASNEEFWLKTANDLFTGTSTVFKAHGRGGTSVTKFSFPNANVSIGTDIVGDSPLKVVGLDLYTSNEDAITGGLLVGEFYRNGAGTDKVCVVH